MTTPDIDLDALEAAALAATPGEWCFGSFGRLLVVPMIADNPDKHSPICDLGEQHFPSHTEPYANAAYIAAANPAVVIELIRRLAHPESASECDNEAMQEIDAAIARAESTEGETK